MGPTTMVRLLTNCFPLLLLALLWTLAAWYNRNFCLPISWSLFALGSAAYLLTLVYFVFFGDRDQLVDVSTRTTTALAVGAAAIFVIYAWDKLPESGNPAGTMSTSAEATKSDGNNPLDSINIFAAILGAILAAVALIAQKSAVDARTEAERARKDILEALDIRIVALSSDLLEHAQAAKYKEEELLQEVEEIADQDQNTAIFLRLGADCLVRSSRFFSHLHRWILEPRVIPANDPVGKATMLLLKLEALAKASNTATHFVCKHELKQLRTEYWRPAIRLIEKLLILGLPNSATPTDAEKVMLKLREVNTMLNKL